MKKGNYFHLKKQIGAKEMTNSKSKNLGKKLAAILLSAVAVTVPALTFGLTSNKVKAATAIPPIGMEVSRKEDAWVIKDTSCVKRWHEYKISVYYMGAVENVFVNCVHEPINATSPQQIDFTENNQLYKKYSLAETTTTDIENHWHLTKGGDIYNYLSHISDYLTEDYTKYYSKAVVESIEKSNYDALTYERHFNVGSAEYPINKYYGDLLMLVKAYKFKIVVHQQQHAKTRSSALSKWSQYRTEEQWDNEYFIYSTYYNPDGNYYRKIGSLGNYNEYQALINNESKKSV